MIDSPSKPELGATENRNIFDDLQKASSEARQQFVAEFVRALAGSQAGAVAPVQPISPRKADPVEDWLDSFDNSQGPNGEPSDRDHARGLLETLRTLERHIAPTGARLQAGQPGKLGTIPVPQLNGIPAPVPKAKS